MDELRQHVRAKIRAIARPEAILFTAELPTTRSGKIVRRLLRDIAEGRARGRHDLGGPVGSAAADRGVRREEDGR